MIDTSRCLKDTCQTLTITFLYVLASPARRNDIIIKGNYLIHSRPIKLILTTFQAHVLTSYLLCVCVCMFVRRMDLSDATLTTVHSFSLFSFVIHTKITGNLQNLPVFCFAYKCNFFSALKKSVTLFVCAKFLLHFKIILFCLSFSLCCLTSTSSRNLFFGTLTLTLFSVLCRLLFWCALQGWFWVFC